MGTSGEWAATRRAVSGASTTRSALAESVCCAATAAAARASVLLRASSASESGTYASGWGDVLLVLTSHASVVSQISRCVLTARSGYLPAADSPDNMTASALSTTAFVTSATSARVGRGFLAIESSICVATMTGLPLWRHASTMSFCHCTTSTRGTSTPRSPRATISPSAASTISPRLRKASTDSILATTRGRSPSGYASGNLAAHASTYLRICRTPSASWTKDAATTSMPCSTPNRMSASSLRDMAGSSKGIPGKLTPFRSPSSPEFSTVVSTSAVAVLLLSSSSRDVTATVMAPSSRRMLSPVRTFCVSFS
mmetsp:Transcript_1717/g.6613  ORF Transcript_1717/g.6613 Transcript_1717/m.6613 type:complete len:313 (+) Transcript_1717:348-1286(+)